MFDSGHDISFCSAVRAQFVCDDTLRRQALFLQQPDQQSLGSLGIAAGLNDLVENVTVLVNGTPEPMFAAADGNHHLVQMVV